MQCVPQSCVRTERQSFVTCWNSQLGRKLTLFPSSTDGAIAVQVLVQPQKIVNSQNGMSGVSAVLLVVSQHV